MQNYSIFERLNCVGFFIDCDLPFDRYQISAIISLSFLIFDVIKTNWITSFRGVNVTFTGIEFFDYSLVHSYVQLCFGMKILVVSQKKILEKVKYDSIQAILKLNFIMFQFIFCLFDSFYFSAQKITVPISFPVKFSFLKLIQAKPKI